MLSAVRTIPVEVDDKQRKRERVRDERNSDVAGG